MHYSNRVAGVAILLAATLAMPGCGVPAPQTTPPGTSSPPTGATTPTPPPQSVEPVAPALPTGKPPPAFEPGSLRAASWSDLPGWRTEDAAAAWTAFLASCRALVAQSIWREPCNAAQKTARPDPDAARRFFEAQLLPFQAVGAQGSAEGLITGYYEPLLRGSRKRAGRYRFPIFGVPDDLVTIDLGEMYPELKGLRLRGRIEGRRVVPYYDRAAIEEGRAGLAGREIAWVDDPVELFFLHVQGSGRIALETGETIHVGFADQNGHPYRSIGRVLIDRGELPLEKASMQGIKAWADANPGRVSELLNQNARYVFFRELPAGAAGPPGALGVPLTPRRSIAVDPRFVPLGAPVYIATTWPLSNKPLNQLVLAQDSGGAILGAVRADYFWGFGEEAAREAGRMKQPLKMWVLMPRGFTPASRD